MSEENRPPETEDRSTRPPRDDLVRALTPGPEVRNEGDGIGKLRGYFAVFDTWTKVDSVFEGRFMERIAPGAFKKAIQESARSLQATFDHGQDAVFGRKPLGPITDIGEDDHGAYYEVDLLDTSYNRDLIPGLRAGVYGSSFRFSVVKEQFDPRPQRSTANPDRLPERTVQEVRISDIGPTPFPVYPEANAGVRSMTDEFMVRKLKEQPERSAALIEAVTRAAPISADPASTEEASDPALPADGADASHSDEGSRSEAPPPQPDPPAVAATPNQDPPERGSSAVKETTVNTIEERRSRVDEIDARRSEIHNEFGVAELPADVQTEWDQLDEERSGHARAIEAYEQRATALQAAVQSERNVERAVPQPRDIVRGGTRTHTPANIYDLVEYRSMSRTDEELRAGLKDGALRSIESAVFPHERANDSKNKEHIERLLNEDSSGAFARHLLATGNPVYQRAFLKLLSGQMPTAEEQRAIGTVGSGQNADGGYAVPYTLDPTIILTSNGQVNPLRQMARVETLTTGNTWKGVTSAGITVSRVAEESAVTPTSPTLAQPSVTVQAVKAEIQYSIESDGDWPRLQAEMARLLQDAKDAEEATQFITGNGNGTTGNPEGVVAGLDASSYVGTTGDGLTVDDLFRLTGALPDRFEPNAQFLGHRTVYNAIRAFGTGSSVGEGAVWQNSLQPGQPGILLGYPARTASGMSSDYTTTDELVLLFGDFQSGYIIVDKVGLSVEIDPHVRNASGQWTGQRALLAHYRNNGMVLVDNALRALKIGVVTS